MTESGSKGLRTLTEAVRGLFGIELSEYPKIKHALNSLVKSKVIASHKEPIGGAHDSRSRIRVSGDQLDRMHNAIVLQGLFSDTRTITKILNDKGSCTFRRNMADFARAILVERRSIVGISLLPQEVFRFLDMLGSDTDLATNRLPNPFEILPQQILNESTDVLQAFIAQSTVLSGGDAMMLHYLAGDLQQAWECAQGIENPEENTARLISLIEREFTEAREFDDLLDYLK